MANDLVSRDRLQPALLDRLLDDDPTNQQIEPPSLRTITKTRLRQSVLRDLTWLLNATAPLHDVDIERYPHAARSSLNYGLPPLTGTLASQVELAELEAMLRDAIVAYEPRILPDSVTVRGRAPDDPLGHHNVLQFEIAGRLWAQPYPLELLLRTDIDLETGASRVTDATAGATPVEAAMRA